MTDKMFQMKYTPIGEVPIINGNEAPLPDPEIEGEIKVSAEVEDTLHAISDLIEEIVKRGRKVPLTVKEFLNVEGITKKRIRDAEITGLINTTVIGISKTTADGEQKMPSQKVIYPTALGRKFFKEKFNASYFGHPESDGRVETNDGGVQPEVHRVAETE